MVEQKTALNTVFHALADPTRRAMLRSLAGGERNVSDLAAPFRMSFAASAKHVKVLENARLVRRKVHGRSHVIRLNAAPLATADKWLRYYERFWTERLDVLEALIRAEDKAAARKRSRR
jgi:DNA-binding transcriptional ArsR family regulator